MSENGGSLKYVYDKSQGSIAKHLSCGGLLHYKFTIQFAGERIYKIGEHLLKLQTIWLIVSYTPFALDFCPQRCRTRQISKITCVWWTETVTNCCYVKRQINVSVLTTNIKLLQTSVDLLTYAISSDWLLSCTAFCCNIFLFVAAVVCVQSIMGLFIRLVWTYFY